MRAIQSSKDVTDDDVQAAIVKHAQMQKTLEQIVAHGPTQFR